MPLYDYRCKECDQTFELRRSIADADRDVRCPSGHGSVSRLLPVFAAMGRSGPDSGPGAGGSPGAAPGGSFGGGGGGCCGGACGCG